MNVVGYIRVSTTNQATDGYGLDVQERAIRAWGRKNGRRVVAVDADVGLSGADDVIARPGLTNALGRLAAGEASGLVVYRLDRLARDVILQETILADLHRAGYVLHSTFPAEDEFLIDAPEDPTRALVRRILGAVAAYERDVIHLRLQAGRARKRAIGGYYGGKPPFGWRAEGHELVEDAAEQRALKRMVELRKGGATLHQVADQLAREGMHPRTGPNWVAGTLANILKRQGIVSPRKAQKAIEANLEGVEMVT